jgi:uncharacterized protein (DUF1697 family)
MRYVALLRGINVGGNNRVEMKRLKAALESLGHTEVVTYINSGNVLFVSPRGKVVVHAEIDKALKKTFGFEIRTIIKTQREMRSIAKAIPKLWKNDGKSEKTDVAYLFKEADSKKILAQLPLRKAFIDVRYVKGALIWNVSRKDYNRSHLNKLISHPLYKHMTVRNVNTAKFLAK